MQDHEDATELMTQFGITKVQTQIYHYRDWKYSNLGDALAQAKRDALSDAAEQNA